MSGAAARTGGYKEVNNKKDIKMGSIVECKKHS